WNCFDLLSRHETPPVESAKTSPAHSRCWHPWPSLFFLLRTSWLSHPRSPCLRGKRSRHSASGSQRGEYIAYRLGYLISPALSSLLRRRGASATLSGRVAREGPGAIPPCPRICRHHIAANDERGCRKMHLSLCRGGDGANLKLGKGMGGS